ncbi:aspartate aminotransferase family protein [Acidithiobacillus sulfuriphilus]|uniref:Aspartate aminotransferase family protein n=2 Tax=Acidithiobacillus sulfuriphilus TaxID=1867749 RepID=A0ACD5HTF3_9PROT|nr:aspartate aminotransferase family protein [Acidithiobacillus sulfuriphilus]
MPQNDALAAFWMPFTANRQFQAAPRLLSRAEGMYYWGDDGREILDATAGLWCVNAGHGRTEITTAIAEQTRRLDFAPTFQMGHPLAFAYAERLVRMLPAPLKRVFFTNSGSEAVDTALKIARAYHFVRGEAQHTIFIGRERAYHGVGFGGLSVGGLPNNREAFGPLLEAEHLPHTLDQERNSFARGLPAFGAERADALEALIATLGAERIAAVIIEPVAGSAGVIVPPVGYLQRLRNICDRHGLLLIFDEVITGFGRLGTPFAADYFGVIPDMLTTAKGLTNGAVPMGAVFVGDQIFQAFMKGPEERIELFHGYTYSGHPLACAAGMATLDIYERESLLTRGAHVAPLFEDAVHSLRGLPLVRDIRNLGLMAAIELEPRPNAVGARGYDAQVQALQRGLLVRAAGDTIALSPPLIVEGTHLDRIIQTLRDVLRHLA